MSADTLVSRVSGVHETGHGRWLACCPAHDDRHASMSIRELDDGRVLVHCFAGCSVEEILGSVGLDFDALFPPRDIHHAPPERRPFNAHDVLQAVAFEALVASCGAGTIAAGKGLTERDRERLLLASIRLQDAASLASGTSISDAQLHQKRRAAEVVHD